MLTLEWVYEEAEFEELVVVVDVGVGRVVMVVERLSTNKPILGVLRDRAVTLAPPF